MKKHSNIDDKSGGRESASRDPQEPMPRGSTGRNEQEPSAASAQHEDVDRNERDHTDELQSDFHSRKNLNSLSEEEETEGRTRRSASYSETDEDEDEGLGDGNIGRSVNSPGLDEEG